MVTVVAIFALLLLALWLCAAIAIGFLLLTWGAPAAAAFAVFVYADRLGVETPMALVAAFLAFVVARMVIVRVIRLLIGLWDAITGPEPPRAIAR